MQKCKSFFFLVAFFYVIAIIFCGCGTGKATAVVDNKSGYVYSGIGLVSQPSPVEVSRAQATVITAEAQANLLDAVTEKIKSGQGASASIGLSHNYVVINQNRKGRTLCVKNPVADGEYSVTAGSSIFIPSTTAIQYLSCRWEDSFRWKKISPTPVNGGLYNGVRVDGGFRAW